MVESDYSAPQPEVPLKTENHIRIFEDAIPPALCRKIMDRFDADKRVQADPQPDYSRRTYLNISRCPDWIMVAAEVCRHVNVLTAQYFARPDALKSVTHTEWADDGYVVARYDTGDACIMHVDGQCAEPPANALRLATLVFYLNTVPEGGEIWFPYQDVRVKPLAGRAVMFPVGFSHPHEVLPTQSPRYVLQTWITDPGLFVVRASEAAKKSAPRRRAGSSRS